jgi:hypothetical protein
VADDQASSMFRSQLSVFERNRGLILLLNHDEMLLHSAKLRSGVPPQQHMVSTLFSKTLC